MVAHNININNLIEVLGLIPDEIGYIDVWVEDDLTIVFKPSEYQGGDGEKEGEIDLKDTII